MAKAKVERVEELKPSSILAKGWESTFFLANETVTEVSKQLESLISLVNESVTGVGRLASMSNQRISSFIGHALAASENGGRELANRTRATALSTAQRASNTAKSLVAPTSKAA